MGLAPAKVLDQANRRPVGGAVGAFQVWPRVGPDVVRREVQEVAGRREALGEGPETNVRLTMTPQKAGA